MSDKTDKDMNPMAKVDPGPPQGSKNDRKGILVLT